MENENLIQEVKNNDCYYPVLFRKNFFIVPFTVFHEDLVDEQEIATISICEHFDKKVLIALENDNKNEYEVFNDKYFKRGLLCEIFFTSVPKKNVLRVKMRVIARVDFNEFESLAECTMGHASKTISSVGDVSLNCDYVSKIKDLVTNSKGLKPQTQVTYSHIKDIINNDNIDDDNILADFIGQASLFTEQEALKFIHLNCATDKLKLIYEHLTYEIDCDEIDKKVEERVRNNMNEQQKEYYLREKMRAIQEELGDKAKKDTDIEELRKSINESGMPESMKTKLLNELNRYSTIPTSSPESAISKTYMDFALSLPWDKQSVDNSSLADAKRILDEDHYGLDKVKDRIIEYLAVRLATNQNPQSILCLVGPPGVGKTSLAKSIARALNKTFVKQSLGGVKDESEIRGHRRTYIGALPGRILQSLAKAKTNNPVFLFDEIDKMASDYKGDPTSAMLEVLDGEQNKFFSDNYLEEPFDLSNCFFICTANYLYNIPAPLRDRLEVIEVSSYTEIEKFNIVRNHLLKKQLHLNGLDENKFSITDDAIYKIIQMYTREAGVREVERLIGTLIRKAIKEILVENNKEINITVDNLEKYLGKVKFEKTENTGKDLVGVVNGLAYTEFGGDILQIEVAHFPGQGHVTITGQLGDVMKESCETALSYVKANAKDFGIDYELFTKSDIHIHVPEGAVPKDGPSAGVTMVTAIVSSFTGKEVNHLLGMTGEITLRGRVLPIGGLREKSIAAHRSGLKTILIPVENKKDIDEIPQEVQKELKIIPIETAQDAIMNAIGK